MHHTIGFPPGAFLGVDLFFVLSGFLITTLLVEEHARLGSVSLPRFYLRRARRLLPALFVVLGVFLTGSVVAAVIERGSFREALVGVVAGVGYFSNILLAAETQAMPRELEHLWSLAIEEQFYVVWPVVLIVLLRVRLRLALLVLTGAIGIATAQQLRLVHDDASWLRIGYGTDTRSTSILVGCLLAIVLATGFRHRLERVAGRAWPLPIAALTVIVVTQEAHVRVFAGAMLVASIGMATMVLVALDEESRFARTLSLPPLVFLGGISYALYLWHVPIYVAFGLNDAPELLDLIALPMAVICATTSYYLVERRFLRRRTPPVVRTRIKRAPVPAAPVAAEA